LERAARRRCRRGLSGSDGPAMADEDGVRVVVLMAGGLNNCSGGSVGDDCWGGMEGFWTPRAPGDTT
jgi:hypothetical protein